MMGRLQTQRVHGRPFDDLTWTLVDPANNGKPSTGGRVERTVSRPFGRVAQGACWAPISHVQNARICANIDEMEPLELIVMDGPFDFSIHNEVAEATA